jgi:hypothetical protein
MREQSLLTAVQWTESVLGLKLMESSLACQILCMVWASFSQKFIGLYFSRDVPTFDERGTEKDGPDRDQMLPDIQVSLPKVCQTPGALLGGPKLIVIAHLHLQLSVEHQELLVFVFRW